MLASLIVLLPVAVIGQTGTARTRGMANAGTAAPKGVAAILFNPAGLAFKEGLDLRAAASGNVGLTKRAVFGFGFREYPYVQADFNDQPGRYVVIDDFLGYTTEFDPSEYGFPYDSTDNDSYVAAAEAYREFQLRFVAHEAAQQISDLSAVPSISFTVPHFGLSTFADVEVDVDEGTFLNADTEIILRVQHDIGAVGGVGWAFGPIAFGANVRVFRRSTADTTVPIDSFIMGEEVGLPAEAIDALLAPTSAAEQQILAQLGLGSMLKLGDLSVGVYVDNALGPQLEDGGLLEQVNVGVARSPRTSVLTLGVAADVRGIFSDSGRELTAGAELGFHLGKVLGADLRAGYRQTLPGPLSEAADRLDPEFGFFSAGIGVRFLFLQIDVSAEIPPDVFFDPPQTGGIAADRLDTPLGLFTVDVSLSN